MDRWTVSRGNDKEGMKLKKGPVAVLVNALIWGFVIIMCSHKLSGTGAYQEIQTVLGAGAAASLLTVGVAVIKKKDRC